MLHYLDYFLIFGPPGPEECSKVLATALDLCARLGVPIVAHKTEGPATRIIFLCIELDSVSRMVQLPEEKLARLQTEVRSWRGRKSCTKQELLSLIGKLQHACCVVKPGRTYLRSMIELSSVVQEPYHRIRLNKGFRSDGPVFCQSGMSMA